MKAVAVFKWSIDPRDILVNQTGEIDRSKVAFWTGDDDYLAVNVASDVVGADGTLTGLTMAGSDIAFAAARGASDTYTIEGCPRMQMQLWWLTLLPQQSEGILQCGGIK